MALVIREIHAAPSRDALNQEWFVVENAGEKPFSTAGCSVAVGRGKRLRTLGQLDPGFTLGAGDKIRIVSGNPGKKTQGTPPADDQVKNYHLFMPAQIIEGPGTAVTLALKQHELVRAVYDPKAPAGVAPQTGS